MKKREIELSLNMDVEEEINVYHFEEIEKKMAKLMAEEIKQELEAKILIGDDKLKALLHKKSKNTYIRKEASRVLKLKP